jgi:hypothetical protein
MSDPAMKIPARMAMAEFAVWDAPDGRRWQLVDGSPEAMAPSRRTHGAIQSELARVIGNHLFERASPCTVITKPGIIPCVPANLNFRIPDLAVSCFPYTTIPSVEETVVLSSVFLRADVVRRLADGSWPDKPEVIESGDLVLDSIGFRAPLQAIYRTTRLAV